jgi:hypothetical protein
MGMSDQKSWSEALALAWPAWVAGIVTVVGAVTVAWLPQNENIGMREKRLADGVVWAKARDEEAITRMKSANVMNLFMNILSFFTPLL